LGLSLILFGIKSKRLYILLKSAKRKAPNRFDRIGKRLLHVLTDAILQKNVLRKAAPGIAHACIFWGFLIITVGTTEMLIEGIFHGANLASVIGLKVYGSYLQIADLFTLLVLCGIAFGFFRRLVLRPKYLATGPDALMILVFTAALMLTLFGLNAFRIALDPNGSLSELLFLSSFFAEWVFNAELTYGQMYFGQEFFYWGHVGMVLGFLVYIPGSKHLHVLAAIPNVFFQQLDIPKPMEKTDLEDENAESFGVGKINELHWKNVLDLFACTECGRCEEVCPADITGKPLSPARLVHDFRHELLEQSQSLISGYRAKETPTLPNIIREGSAITGDVIWACTSCRACEEVCPVNIEQVDLIFEARKAKVLMEADFPSELATPFRNLENNYTPWNFGHDTRTDWCESLGVRQMADHPNAEVLYYVGCAGSFDDRAKKVATAIVKLLQKANVDFAILGKEEKCTGDPARRAGNEYLAQMLIKENVATLNKYKPRKILAACPHCFNILKNEYPQFGAQYDVVHHSTFLMDLVKQGKLIPNKSSGTVTYHDSCYLGRWNGNYDDPREILRAAGLEVREMKRSRNNGLCCGAGGARMFMEETIGKRINIERTEEAIATKVETIAVACPFCTTMLTDGTKAKGVEIQVKDIAEILAEATA